MSGGRWSLPQGGDGQVGTGGDPPGCDFCQTGGIYIYIYIYIYSLRFSLRVQDMSANQINFWCWSHDRLRLVVFYASYSKRFLSIIIDVEY